MQHIDSGIRCDRHVGEVFPVRCVTCDLLTSEWNALQGTRRAREYDPLERVNCSIDNPCEQCRAEAARALG